MNITVGRIVLYTLSEDDAMQINRRRTTSFSIKCRINQTVENMLRVGDLVKGTDDPTLINAWPLGAQAHIGNDVKAGQAFPMIVVAVWGTQCCNGQVFLDGNDVYWVRSVTEGTGSCTWAWPAREPNALELGAAARKA